MPVPNTPLPDRFSELLDEAAKQALFFQQPQPFLDWLQAELVERGAEFVEIAEPEVMRALALHLGMALWNHLPLPRNRFRPEPLPKPERNQRCPCGAERKYKQCCGRLPQTIQMDADTAWHLALPHLPRPALRQAIAAQQVPVMIIGRLAEEALERGQGREAVHLLESLFKGELSVLDHRHAEVLNLLCDAFDAVERTPRRKRLLLERLCAAPDKTLRANAWQRLASHHMDQGHDDQAWHCFEQAQRADPGDPDLAMLELLLLCARDEQEQARARARFWLQQYQRRGIDDPDRLEFLRAAQHDPIGALAVLGRGHRDPALLQLEDLLSGCTLPESSAYQVVAMAAADVEVDDPVESLRRSLHGMGIAESEIQGHLPAMQAQIRALIDAPAEPPPDRSAAPRNEHVLQADAAMCALETRWRACYPGHKPHATLPLPADDGGAWAPAHSERWLRLLLDHPEALNSFDVLDDLLIALDLHAQTEQPGVFEALARPLLEHAAALLRQTLGDAPELRLPWSLSDNRPALRLLSRRIQALLGDGDPDAAMRQTQALLRLNPDDNHGYRCLLANHYLLQGQDQALIELRQRYADDDVHPELVYGHALALVRLGHRTSADVALARAREALPEVARALLAANYRTQKPDPLGIAVGRREQAAMYRQYALEAWQATPGALDRLRAVAPDKARRSRR